VRIGDGSITYTRQGAADEGLFDSAAGTITVKVALAKLNALLPAATLRSLPAPSWRACAGRPSPPAPTRRRTSRAAGRSTRSPAALPRRRQRWRAPGNGKGNVVRVTGGEAIDGKRERFNLQASTASAPARRGQIRYRDNGNGFDMVSDTIDTFTQNGSNEVVLTGEGHVGSTAVTFTVRVQDNGEPGSRDYFSIVIPGYPAARNAHPGQHPVPLLEPAAARGEAGRRGGGPRSNKLDG